MSLLSTTTILSEKASGNRTEENRSSKLSIDAAHPFAAASLTESSSLGCYNGSEATHWEKDVPLTVQNKMSSASAETLYSLRNDWMNSGQQYCDGPSYRSRWIGITRGKQWDLSKRIQFNPTSMMLSCTVCFENFEKQGRVVASLSLSELLRSSTWWHRGSALRTLRSRRHIVASLLLRSSMWWQALEPCLEQS